MTDPGGRYVVVFIEVYSHHLALVNMYIPPPFSSAILYDVLDKLAPHSPFKLLIAGDFNNILDYTIDTSNPQRAPNHDLSHWATAAGFTELWRWKHPTDRCYSYLSQVFASSSRIDMAFANAALLPMVSEVTYLPGSVSDHTPLSLILQLGTHRPKGTWHLSPSWVGEPSVEEVLKPHFNQHRRK